MSMAQNRAAENSAVDKNQHVEAPIKPDLSHRLCHSDYDPGCCVQLSDAVNNMVDRASGVLNLLSLSYTGLTDCQPNDETVFYVLESAIQELADIRATVGAFYDVQRAKSDSERKADHKTPGNKKPA